MTRDSDEDAGWNGLFFQTPDGSVNAIESRCWRQSVIDPRRPEEDGVIIHSRIESSHLAGNLLGDPSERAGSVRAPTAGVRGVGTPVSHGLPSVGL